MNANMTAAELTEHPAQIPQALDNPFPYGPEVEASKSAPYSSKKSALAFFLQATGANDVKELEAKSRSLQEEAYKLWPYPCIRRWSFLSTKNAEHPIYERILKLGTESNAIFLELGCFFGTDSRRLTYDGWDPSRIVGTDLRPEWFEKGYELFSDKSTCEIKFIPGDIFDSALLPTSFESGSSATIDVETLKSLNSLAPLQGHVRAMSAFSFFHLFEEQGQFELAKRVATLISPKKGSIIFGAHQGGIKKGSLSRANSHDPNATRFVHSPESWVDMWETEIFPSSRDSSVSDGSIRVKATAKLVERSGPIQPNSTSTMGWIIEVL
ncbi:hypothetical protein BD324DRAFT_623461 [Kockovaella imperatae]|uniref:Methyltransferase domain-containing protein n=1 Tax=Kockovaella imperatae TaxID=4999 RepID=A0A1Y1UK36_9TREE|nr:hypothetical protein BD324DRAFT_623461 [Kockovaella imperatae]ORX37826.1 hypothetical protein BD324DRAFT_623461 [Kockovaella imperatae]